MEKQLTAKLVSPETFDLEAALSEMVSRYNFRGYHTRVYKTEAGLQLILRKNRGKLHSRLGLGVGAVADLTVKDGELVVTYTDSERQTRIECLIFGWFLLLVPAITALVGLSNQNGWENRFRNELKQVAKH